MTLLKELIRDSGYNLSTFAEAINMPVVTMNRKLNGHSQFTLGEIISMIEVLNVSDEKMMKILHRDYDKMNGKYVIL